MNAPTPVPPAKTVPPVATSYQSITFPALLAEILTVPVPHLEPLVPVGAVGIVFTVAVTAVLVADVQPVVVFLV